MTEGGRQRQGRSGDDSNRDGEGEMIGAVRDMARDRDDLVKGKD